MPTWLWKSQQFRLAAAAVCEAHLLWPQQAAQPIHLAHVNRSALPVSLFLQLLLSGLTGRWSSGPGQPPRSCSSQPASSALQQQQRQQARRAPALQTQAQTRADASSSSQESLLNMQGVLRGLGTTSRRGRKRLAALSLDRTAAAGWHHAALQAHWTLAGQQLRVLLATLCQPPQQQK